MLLQAGKYNGLQQTASEHVCDIYSSILPEVDSPGR